MSFVNNVFQTTLPPQQIALSKKLEDLDDFGVSKWMKQNMDALEGIGRLQWSSNYALKENYDLIRGRFIMQHYIDSNDYFDLSSAISQEFNIPSYLRHYDITSKAVNVLVGEFLKRPDGFRVRANDKQSHNEIMRVKTSMLHSYVKSRIQEEINKTLLSQGIDPNRTEFKDEEEQTEYQEYVQQQQQALTPPQLESYLKNDYMTSAEQFGQHVIELDRERFNLKEKEAEEFEDMLVADRCFRHFFLTATGYTQETWNPLNTFFHRSPEIKYIEDGDYVGRVFWLSKAQIIDRYGWMMCQEQLEALYPNNEYKGTGDAGILNEAFSASIYPFADYRDYMHQVNALGYDPHTGFPFLMNQMNQMSAQDIDVLFGSGFALNFRVSDIIMVTEGYWRSQKKIGKLNYIDPETQQLTSQLVDETFKPKLFGIKELSLVPLNDNNEPNTISWSWVTQIWKGIKINVNYSDSNTSNNDVNKFSQRALYIGVEPAPFQFKGEYNPFIACKLPVIGQVFNNRNGDSMSLVDLIKPYQVFYNICYNQAYELSQREIGKFILMDMNLLPNLKDWGGGENYEKFLAIAKSMGIGVIDTKALGTGQTTFASTNSYQVMDASETDRIAAKINLGVLIEQQAYRQLGINDARLGNIAASATATGIEQETSASYSQTESYFEKFYNYKRRCLQANVEIAQHVYAKEKDITLNYTSSDLSRAFVSITDPDLLLRDLGVYPTFSQEITRQLETIRQLAINNNTTNIPMSKLVNMITMNSVREIQKALESSEVDFAKQQQAANEAKMQEVQATLQAQAEEKQKDRDLKKYEVDTKANTELQKVTLQGISNESSFNPDVDLTDKLIAQRDISLKENQASQNAFLQQQQLSNQVIDSFNKKKTEENKLKSDKEMKTRELKIKESLANKQNEGIDKQSKNQELMQRTKIAADEKLAKLKGKLEQEKKDKELEILDKKLEIIDAEVEAKKKIAVEEVKQVKTKTDTDNKLGQVEAKVQTQLGSVKVQEAKKLSKIKLDATKKISAKRVKDAGKPKK